MSLAQALIEMAEDEGRFAALQECDFIIDTLETVLECGSSEERAAARVLRSAVNEAVAKIRG